ncbi:MAG: histidinol-phosphate transaminase [Lentisphaerae bacterium]|nr:histidinol-phosphate transaminase [Lentisphaerota bacterium]
MTLSFERLANPWIARLTPYEPGRPIEEVAREFGIEDVASVVKLASNENALGPSPRAVAAMRRSAREMHRYPDGGAFYLRNALAERLNVPPACILPGNGSNELIELLAHVFLGPETAAVMAERAFVVYRLVAEASRARVIAVPMKDYTHDLDAMRAAITPDTRMVFVGNPNNPTGTMVDGPAIDRFMAGLPDNVIVCFDEAYIELVPPEIAPDTLAFVRKNRPVVVLRTFSKTYGLAGLRVGYAVAPEACVALLDRARQPFNVNAMAQAAALAALGDAEHLARTRRLVRGGLAYLEEEFDRMGLPFVPAVANFILVDVGDGRRVFRQLQERGVIVRPMDGYGLPSHVRVTVGTRAENQRFIEDLRKVLA